MSLSYYIMSLSYYIMSLEWYTDNHSASLNQALIDDEKFTELETKHLSNIDKCFENCPIYYKNITIYRGTKHLISTGLFLSCTTDILIAINFGNLHTINCT